MEKRLILAVLMMSAVIMLTNLLFPPPEPQAEGGSAGDSAVVAASPGAAGPLAGGLVAPAPVTGPADSVVVTSDLYRYVLSTRGGALLSAELLEYRSYVDEGEPVQLVPPGTTDFLAHRLVVGGDTLDLRAAPFQASARSVQVDEAGGPRSVQLAYGQPGGLGAEITYTFHPDRYVVEVQGRILGLGGRSAELLTRLGPGLAPNEAFDHHNEQQLAAVTRVPGDVERVLLRKVEGTQSLGSGLTWAGIKDKYFLAAVIPGEQTPFSGAVVRGLPATTLTYPERDETVQVPQAELVTALPLGADGAFAYQTYLGPQEYDRLAAAGYDLENVTQYAYRWLEPIIRPVVALILWVLETLHNTLGLAYGWVLVLFGVLMRIVLWPLNAKAMRAQMKNMGVQPLLQEIREKYRDDPQKQQEAMLKLYKEHGFNPLAGCLPMLVPFPVLITLFFVFQNTIAFRGAEFLWLPDLSLRDPYYILPLILIVSAFGLQWVSAHLSGMEQNPQMKMMMYVMPVMMGVIFISLPAGLNLYYSVTQVASIPQQVLIAKERRRAQEEMKKSSPRSPSPTPAGSRGKGRRRA